MNTIILTPNKNNAIYVMTNSEEKLIKNDKHETIIVIPYADEAKLNKNNYDKELFFKNYLNCFKCVQCSTMDGKILKFIKDIVYKNNNNNNNNNNSCNYYNYDNGDVDMTERLKSIEQLLKMILMKKQI